MRQLYVRRGSRNRCLQPTSERSGGHLGGWRSGDRWILPVRADPYAILQNTLGKTSDMVGTYRSAPSLNPTEVSAEAGNLWTRGAIIQLELTGSRQLPGNPVDRKCDGSFSRTRKRRKAFQRIFHRTRTCSRKCVPGTASNRSRQRKRIGRTVSKNRTEELESPLRPSGKKATTECG